MKLGTWSCSILMSPFPVEVLPIPGGSGLPTSSCGISPASPKESVMASTEAAAGQDNAGPPQDAPPTPLHL